MNKELIQNINHRSKLKNILFKYPSQNNRFAYKVQRNKCVRLLRKAKTCYYNNLDTNRITDNKMFWKTMKPLFNEKFFLLQKLY